MTKEERLIRDGGPENYDPVLFYGKDDLGSNFSAHVLQMFNPFTGELVRYQTGEHRFQAMKAMNNADHEFVRNTPTPAGAKLAGRSIDLRPGWGGNVGDLCWYVMMETVMEKTLQHEDVRDWLECTDRRTIYEDSPTDLVWGWRQGENYSGRNLLGLCWMETRRILERSIIGT